MKLTTLNFEEFSGKKAIIQKLKSMGLPTPKTEHYRYFGIKPIFEKEYDYTPQAVQQIEEADHIEVLDGVITKAPKSLYIEMAKEVKVDDSHYDQVYYLSHLFSEIVPIIEIDSDMELRIVQKFTKNGAFVPSRIKLDIKPNVQVKIVEEYIALSESSLYMYGYDIDIAQDASLTFISSRVTNIADFALFGSHAINIGKNATFNLYTFDIGNAKTINNFHTVLEDHATSDQNHMIFAKSEARLGNTFHVEHRGRESKTTQISRNILKDKGRGIFDGLLIVKNPAKYSSIYQDSKTILLNDGAYMISKPQMEIYTEYIAEATHGSTTGHLDEEALFYLQQRGIAKEDAKEMLVLSFLNEIFEKLGDESFKEEFVKIYEENR